MFFKLASQNSRRNRKENTLFFSSLLIVIIAFYMILSMANQDVMLFLAKMESDAVSKLLLMIPLFYGATLFILFFLVYDSSKYQMEQRRHEFGVYLMMGMRRSRLFLLLLTEDFQSSVLSLVAGLPIAVLLSEIISLVTARLVGLGIVDHRFSISFGAIAGTAIGFMIIKLLAFVILSRKISRQEIGALLTDTPEEDETQKSPIIYIVMFFLGLLLMGSAYFLAIHGVSWRSELMMGITLLLGISGTVSFFYGMRILMERQAKKKNTDTKLRSFTFRQLQENIIHQSTALAVSSLLILAALCFFGAGIAIAKFYGQSEPHGADYTFMEEERAADLQGKLEKYQLQDLFQNVIEIKTGHISSEDGFREAYKMPEVLEAIEQFPESKDKEVLLNNLGYEEYPYLISLSGYNALLKANGQKEISLRAGEAVVYMDSDYAPLGRRQILNEIFQSRPKVQMGAEMYQLTGEVQSMNLVADRAVTFSFALIIPDLEFEKLTEKNSEVYLDGILSEKATKNESLLRAILAVNKKLDDAGFTYESYLQSMGRKLFYVVATSYITIYLAVILLIVANTAIGVQFLTQQQKSGRRYQTLIRLGATYETICQSANKQIYWYFGIPVLVAWLSSFFGLWSLRSIFISVAARRDLPILLLISMSMVLLLSVVECIYIITVKRQSNRYLLSLMVPEREE